MDQVSVSLLLIGLVLLYVVIRIVQDKRTPHWGTRLEQEMQNVCKAPVSEGDLTNLLCDDKSGLHMKSVKKLCRLKSSDGHMQFLLSGTYVIGREEGDIVVLITEMSVELPYLYFLGPHSDYDGYDTATNTLHKCMNKSQEVRVVADKLVTKETIESLVSSDTYNELCHLLGEISVDVQVSGKHVYIFDFYNSEGNLHERELPILLEANRLMVQSIVPHAVSELRVSRAL